MAQSHLVTAAKVKLYINGKPFGRVNGFSWASETPRRPIYGVDSTQPYELAVTTTRCTGTISVMKITADGGAEGAGVTAPYPEISRERYFSLALIEIGSDLVIFQADRCSLVSQSWNAPARGLITGSFSFEAIDWTNEVTAQASL